MNKLILKQQAEKRVFELESDARYAELKRLRKAAEDAQAALEAFNARPDVDNLLMRLCDAREVVDLVDTGTCGLGSSADGKKLKIDRRKTEVPADVASDALAALVAPIY